MRKSIWILLLAGCSFCCASFSAQAQQFKDHISRQFSLQKKASLSQLAIYNLNGSIRFEGYSGNKILIEIDENIIAETEQEISRARKEVNLQFEQTADSITAYIAEPFDTRPHRNSQHYHQDRDIDYQLKLNFVVKVPFGLNLTASTVNNGNIEVHNVAGSMTINNVNGAIAISGAKGNTHAHTINGNLTIDYLEVPAGASSYYTLNGELSVSYPSNLSADLLLKSMNGKFFTDFRNVEVLPEKVIKTAEKNDHVTTYKLIKDTELRIGQGGRLFKFETLNGNIYIKKHS